MLWLKHVILMVMDMHANELPTFLKVKNILLGLQSKTRLITLSICSDTEDLVTVMTCNEIFDPGHPDTFGEPV